MKKAFTLIEIIASLALLGILSAIIGLMLSSTIQRYGLERQGAADNQKLHNAVARITKEFSFADWSSVSIDNNGRSVSWLSLHPERVSMVPNSLDWPGPGNPELLLNGTPLIDRVEAFSITGSVSAGSLEFSLRTGGRNEGITTVVNRR